MIVAQLFVVRLWSSVWSFNAAHISCKYTPLPFVKIKISGLKEREREINSRLVRFLGGKTRWCFKLHKQFLFN
jgi:hypothetical protein